MQVEIGIKRFKFSEKIRVETQTEIGMMTTLKEQLIASKAKHLFNFFLVLIYCCDVSIRSARLAKEVAELTIGNTNVGGV